MVATEYAVFPVRAGVDVADENNEGSKIFQQCLDILTSQPGLQRCYYSHEHENPSNLRLFADWDDVEAHIAFTKSEAYGPMLKLFSAVVEPGSGYLKHVHVDPYPPSALNAPATEVFTAFFPENYTEEQRNAVSATWKEFIKSSLAKSPEFTGDQHGWAVENDVPVTGHEGKTGSLFVSFIGWTSVQAHLDFKNEAAFQDNIGKIRNLPEMIALNAIHVHCKTREGKQ